LLPFLLLALGCRVLEDVCHVTWYPPFFCPPPPHPPPPFPLRRRGAFQIEEADVFFTFVLIVPCSPNPLKYPKPRLFLICPPCGTPLLTGSPPPRRGDDIEFFLEPSPIFCVPLMPIPARRRDQLCGVVSIFRILTPFHTWHAACHTSLFS